MTESEKALWQALRAGRFAGFKFRRQYSIGPYRLDFFCPLAKISIELDGSQHGLPQQQLHDTERREFLEAKGITELRFWNSQWQMNREGVLLEIWQALHQKTGCVSVERKIQNRRFIPPHPDQIIPPSASAKPSL